jgi:hypothetical protein
MCTNTGLMGLYNLEFKNCISFASDGARKIILMNDCLKGQCHDSRMA